MDKYTPQDELTQKKNQEDEALSKSMADYANWIILINGRWDAAIEKIDATSRRIRNVVDRTDRYLMDRR